MTLAPERDVRAQWLSRAVLPIPASAAKRAKLQESVDDDSTAAAEEEEEEGGAWINPRAGTPVELSSPSENKPLRAVVVDETTAHPFTALAATRERILALADRVRAGIAAGPTATEATIDAWWSVAARYISNRPDMARVSSDGLRAHALAAHAAIRGICESCHVADICAFIVTCVAEPATREPDAKRYRSISTLQLIAEAISVARWLDAVCWLVIGIYESASHYAFIESRHVDVCRDFPGFASWLRACGQKQPSWLLARLFFCGGSNLGALTGMAYAWSSYGTRAQYRPLVARDAILKLRGAVPREDIGVKSRLAQLHGTVFEPMGRCIFENLFKQPTYEAGMAVLPYLAMNQSPDGLVLRTGVPEALGLPALEYSHRQRPALTQEQLDVACATRVDGPASDEVAALWRGGGGAADVPWPTVRPRAIYAEAMLEIKCHYMATSAYSTCPPGYLPQVLLGMMAHGVDTAYFISLYYAPHRHDARQLKVLADGSVSGGAPSAEFLTVTVEKIQISSVGQALFYDVLRDVMQHMDGTFDSDTAGIRFGARLMRALEGLEARLEAHVTRSHPTVKIRGHAVVLNGAKLSLADALGSTEEAEYWKDTSVAFGRDTEHFIDEIRRETEAFWASRSAEATPRQGPTHDEQLAALAATATKGGIVAATPAPPRQRRISEMFPPPPGIRSVATRKPGAIVEWNGTIDDVCD